jgi:tetratricopeptide (TPR) repeat protein
MSPWVRHFRTVFPLFMIGACSTVYFRWTESALPAPSQSAHQTESSDQQVPFSPDPSNDLGESPEVFRWSERLIVSLPQDSNGAESAAKQVAQPDVPLGIYPVTGDREYQAAFYDSAAVDPLAGGPANEMVVEAAMPVDARVSRFEAIPSDAPIGTVESSVSVGRIPANPVITVGRSVPDQVVTVAHQDFPSEPSRSVLESVTPPAGRASGVGPWSISDQTLQIVAEHLEYGNHLARRSAVQLAQQEFYKALATLTEAVDQLSGNDHRSEALRQGFLALEESSDFESNGQIRPVDLKIVVQKHTTPVIREGYVETASHVQARHIYLLYAKQRWAAAIDGQPLAGEMLYSLGKLHLVSFEQGRKVDSLELLKAEALFESALFANPEHVKANNELAVLKAKNGDWELAQVLLQRAVIRDSQFLEAWQNLVKVHQRLNQIDLAASAKRQVDRLLTEQGDPSGVRMVSNAEFAATESALASNDDPRVPSRSHETPLYESAPNGPLGAGGRPLANPRVSPVPANIATPFGSRTTEGR